MSSAAFGLTWPVNLQSGSAYLVRIHFASGFIGWTLFPWSV